MTFKVGDRVRVVDNQFDGDQYHYHPIGTIVTITGICGDNYDTAGAEFNQTVKASHIEPANESTTTTTNVSGAVKHDDGKVRVDLLPVTPLLGVAGVLTFGAKKYAPRNWEKGFEWSRPYGAALRHQLAFWGGEDLDPETKLHHLDHALCELMFLREFVKTHPELDNRPSKVVAK